MPAPLHPKKRAAILADIRSQTTSRNAIARKHHVASSTVSAIAKSEHIDDAFGRSKTEQATRARVFDAKLARAQLVEDLLQDAQRMRERIWGEYTQIVSGPAGAEFVTTKMPPIRDQQAGFTSVAIAIDKAGKLSDEAGGDGSAHARTLLGQLGDAFKIAAGEFPESTDPDPGPGDGA